MRFDKRIVKGGLDTIYYRLERRDFEPGDEPYRLIEP